MELFWFWALIQVVAAGGWFFCLGHLLTVTFAPNHNKWPVVFAVGVAAIGALLSLVTPFIAIPISISVPLGLLWVFLWAWKKPPLPILELKKPTITHAICAFFLSIYGYVILVDPSLGYDVISYHLPFIQEFATNGSIPIPSTLLNWVDHVHIVYPKAVELILGLFQALVPIAHAYRIIQFLGFVVGAWGVYALAQSFQLKKPLHAVLLFLSTALILDYAKFFYVEFFIFLWVLLLLEWFHSKEKSIHPILFAIIGFAIASAKISALPYVMAIVGVSFLFNRNLTTTLAAFGGAVAGLMVHAFGIWLAGHSLWDELKISQAVSTGITTDYGFRIWIMLQGFWENWILTSVGIGMLLIPLLIVTVPRARPLLVAIAAAVVALFVSLLVSDLYALTYLQFGTYYGIGFFGIAVLFLSLFLEQMKETKNKLLSHAATAFLVVIVVAGLIGQIGFIDQLSQGNVQGYHAYERILEQIPNESTTKIHFMNNVNPITYGLEKAQIYDFTYYPRLEGDPCTFWKENGFTHVIFWRLVSTSYQLDGGAPAFYERARESLQKNECSTLLIPAPTARDPIVTKIITGNP